MSSCSVSWPMTRWTSAFSAVDLVEGDDDRHVGRLRVVQRLDGLGHDPVIGRHHEDDDVGGIGARGPAWR